MANVTGDSAEKVSSYMTGIWNNFDDGSRSIESYADVITKLGAATASASDEIAEGLQKFSAVADTVGLSYNYAATAMATVSAQTRESADVIGTSFKTILARLESLSLGETLDDDTTLTQYSAALATVGVNIKDQSGQLKDMDTILDELGAKWTTISRDQQVALAQTVAGMRQYNNFIALLDNYDTFKVNLEIAESSEGSLQEQADIYAESWEAAEERVQASLETLYNSLLDDKFFIGVYNGLAKIIDGVKAMTDGLGGLKGVVSLVSTILLRTFGSQLAEGINNSIYNIRSFFGITQKKAEEMKESLLALKKEKREASLTGEEGSEERKVSGEIYDKKIDLEEKILNKDKKYSENQVNNFKIELERYKEYSDVQIAVAKKVDDTRKAIEELNKALEEQNGKVDETTKAQEDYEKQLEEIRKQKAEQQKIAGSKRVASVQEQLGKSGAVKEAISSSILSEKQVSDITGTRQQAADVDAIKEKVLEAFQNYVSKDLDTQTSAESIKEFQENLDSIIAEAESIGSGEADALVTFLKERKAVLTQTKGGEDRKQRVSKEINEMLNAKGGLVGAIDEGIYKELEEIIRKAIGEKTGLSSTAKDYSSEKIQKIINEIAKATRSTTVVGEEGSEEAALKVAELTENEKKLIEELKKAVDAANDAKKGQEELTEDAKNLNEALQGQEKRFKGIGEAMDNLNPNKNNIFTWEDVGPMFTNIATAATSFTSVLSSLSGLWNTLQNPDTSGWEKVVSVFSVLASTVYSVTSMIKSLREIKELSSILLNTIAIKLNTKARKENAAVMVKQREEQTKNIVGNTAENASTNKNTGRTASQSWKDIGSYLKGGGLKSIGTALLKFLPILAVVAAEIAITAIAVKNIQKDAQNVKDLTSQVEKLTEATQELSEAYNNTKSLASSYSETSEKLKTLTKGTAEYADALQSANEDAMELLETNKNLSYSVEGGLIIIDSEDLETAQLESLQKYQSSLSAQYSAEAALKAAEQRVKDVDYVEDNKSTNRKVTEGINDVNAGLKGAGLGAGAGAAAGALIGGPVGGVVGMVVGAIGGAVAGVATELSSQKSEARETADALEEIAALYKKDSTILAGDFDKFKTAVSNAQIDVDEDWLKALYSNTDALRDQLNEINLNTEQIKLLRKQQVSSANAGKEWYSQTIYQDAINTEVSKQIEEITESEVENLVKEFNEKGWNSDEVKKKIFGDDYKDYKITQTGGGDVTVKKWDDEKKEWVVDKTHAKTKSDGSEKDGKNDVSKETLARIAAEAEKANLSAEQGQKLINKYSDWRSMIGLHSATGTAEDDNSLYATMTAALAGGETVDLSAFAQAGIKSLAARLAGEDQNDEVVGLLQKSIEENKKALSNLIGGYSDAVGGLLSGLTNVSMAQTEAIGDVLTTFEMAGGSELANGASAFLNTLASENEAVASKIYSAFSSIDWSDPEYALRKFKGELIDLDVTISDADWSKFEELVSQIGNSAVSRTVEQLKENIQAVTKAVEDIELGSIVSEEDYNTLVEYNGALKEFFMITANGYKWIGTTQDLIAGTTDLLNKDIRTQFESNKLAREGFDALKQIGDWSVLADGSADQDKYIEAYNAIANSGDSGAAALKAAGITNVEGFREATLNNETETLKKLWSNLNTVYTKNTNNSYGDSTTASLYADTLKTTAALEAQKDVFEEYDQLDVWQKQYDYLVNSSEELTKQLETETKLTAEIERRNRAIEKLQKKVSNSSGQASTQYALQIQSLYQVIADDYDAKARAQMAELEKHIQDFQDKYGIRVARTEEGAVDLDAFTEAVKEAHLDETIGNEFITKAEEYSDKVVEYSNSAKEAIENGLSAVLDSFDKELQEKIDDIDFKSKIREIAQEFSKTGSFDQDIMISAALGDFSDDKEKWDASKEDLKKRAEAIAKDYGYATFNPETATEDEWNSLFVQLATQDEAFKTSYEKYKQYELDVATSAQEALEEITSQVGELFDDLHAEFDSSREDIERLLTLISSYQSIVSTVGKETLGVTNDQIRAMNAATIEGLGAKLTNDKNEIEEAKKGLADLQKIASEGYAAVTDKDNIYFGWTKDQIDKAIADEQDKIEELEGNLVSTLSSSLSEVMDIYSSNLDLIMEEFEESVSGAAGSLDWLASQFERQTELSDLYLKDYEKVYELSKLKRQIEKSMDSASTIKAQRSLRDLTAEIASLESSGAKVSAYQLEMLQKKYELKLAEANLESGQAGQYQMVLRRNENGGWSYEYSAVEEAEDALQSYEDALYALTETNQTHLSDLQSGLISLQSNLKSDLLEIAEDMTLSTEEKQERMRELMEYYNEQLGYYESELKLTLGDAQALFMMNQNVVTTWADTLMGQLTGTTSVNDSLEKIKETCSGAVNEIDNLITETFGENGSIKTLIQTVGADLPSEIDKIIYGDDNNTSISQRFADALSDFTIEGTTWETAFEKIKEGINTALKGISDKLKEILNDFEEVEELSNNSKAAESIIAGKKLEGLEANSTTDTALRDEITAYNSNVAVAEATFRSAYTSAKTDEEKKAAEDAYTADYNTLKSTYSTLSERIKTGNTTESKTETKEEEKTETSSTVSPITIEESAKKSEEEPRFKFNKHYLSNFGASFNFEDLAEGESESGTLYYTGASGNRMNDSHRIIYFNTVYKDSTQETVEKFKEDAKAAEIKVKEKTPYLCYDNSSRGLAIFLNNVLYKGGAQTYDVLAPGVSSTIIGFDTGGYTGEWDSSGKLAVLHQKELVLNAEDTSNILSAVDIIRQVAQVIDLGALRAAQLSGGLALPSLSETAQTLQQEVTIHAEFPNATDHNEIEEAFNQLINHTAQYISRS